MSECGHDRSDLVALLEDDLEPARRRIVERVDACGRCADELRALRRTWDGLPDGSDVDPPAAGRHDVLAYARDAGDRRPGVPAGFWRAALLGGLGSLGGYLVLSLLQPIPGTVEFCQVRIFRDPAMSLGQICLVYAAVAALYAGVPVGVTAFLSSGGDGWRVGIAEAAVFTLLALPVFGLQFGLENVAVTGTALAGAALGAAGGGFVGGLARRARRALRLGVLVAAVLPLAGPSPVSAQALPFHTATGITAGFNENAARSFVTSLGRSGLVRDGTAVADPMNRDIDALGVVNGAILGGFTPFWTYRVIVPWVRKSMVFTAPDGRRLHYEASGIGDAILQSKWIFFRSNQVQGTTRLGLQARLTVPLGETDARLPTGQVAPRPLQVGNGSWDVEPTLVFTRTRGRWGLHANAGWRLNTEDEGFEAGDVFSYDAAVGFRFVPWTYESLTDPSLVAYLELNGRVSQEDRVPAPGGGPGAAERPVEDPNSGGHVLFLSPDLQWVPTPWLLFEGSVQVPVLQELNGTQLEHETRFQLGTRFRFSVFR